MEKSRSLNIDENLYFEIIKNKTASLLASGCAAGAWSATNNPDLTEKLRSFGEKVGIAFQIKDDLFDYFSDNVGKPTGNDIKEKKLTLPLIYTLNKTDKATRRQMIYIIKNQNKKKDKVNFVIEKVKEFGGITYAVEKMNTYKKEALEILNEFPETDARKALSDLVSFVTDRKY
jgi:octaprenyl-diphosphate synthase